MIESLSETVDKLYKKTLHTGDSNQKLTCFEHTKIVSWLLNRPVEENEKLKSQKKRRRRKT